MTSQDQHDAFPLCAFVEVCFSFRHVCRQVTAYGGELRYTVSFEPYQRSRVIDGRPDVVLQGNNIFLEHFSQTKVLPRLPQTVTVTFREVCFTVHLKPEGLRCVGVSIVTLVFAARRNGGVLTVSRALVSTC